MNASAHGGPGKLLPGFLLHTTRSIIALLLAALCQTAIAQPRVSSYEVWQISFVGEKLIKEDQLRSALLMAETPRGVWRLLSALSEKIGGEKKFFDPALLAVDYSRIRSYYNDYGFFYAEIDTSIEFDHADKRVSIAYTVKEGPRSFIDTVQVNGLDSLPPDVAEAVREVTTLKRGDPFVKAQVLDQRAAIIRTLVNSGYVSVRSDTLDAARYSSTNNVRILMSFRPGRRYRVGHVTVVQDTTVGGAVDPAIVVRHLDLKEGEYFSEEKRMESERLLNRLGVFEATKVEHQVDGREDTTTTLPVNVFVRTRYLQEIAPSIGIDDKANALNVTVGLGYSHRNFLGGARNLYLKTEASISEVQRFSFNELFTGKTLRDTTVVGQTEISLQLIQPYFFSNRVTLTMSLASIVDKQRLYYLVVSRAKAGVLAQVSRQVQALADWNLEYVRPEFIVPAQRDSIIKFFPENNRPQFNSILVLTVQRDGRNDIFDPSEGFFQALSLEESGLFPSIFGGVFGSNLPYSQYWKITATQSYFYDVTPSRTLVWAGRVRGGVAQLYGNSPANVPFTRRFFGGGSSSIRGWRARTLGILPAPDEGGTVFLEGSVESRWRLFAGSDPFWFIPLERISTVFFFDIGNVWNRLSAMRLDQLAMATGFGLRYETVAGPIRLDFGMRVYDPIAAPHRKWITQKRFFPETLSDFVLHIGIGHAF